MGGGSVKRVVWLLLCVLSWATASASVLADEAPASHALNQRLEALDEQERTLLAPLLERGPVALVELAKEDILPSVLVATYVDAPADLVARVIAQPQDYPKFM